MKNFCIYSLLLAVISMMSCSTQEELKTLPSAQTVVSNEISIDEAQTNLEGIIKALSTTTRTPFTSLNKKITSRYSTKGVLSRVANNDSSFVYIFNLGDKNGYAIMSSDRRLPSLLALTNTGELTPDSIIRNPGQIMFLANTDNYLKALKTKGIGIPNNRFEDGDHEVYGDWETTVCDIPEIRCKVKWNQDGKYAKFCPDVVVNGIITRPVTGCVATATAQLMSIYKYPNSYKNYVFDWNEMTKNPSIDNYTMPKDTVTVNQIARVMQLLGLKENLNMKYGLESSASTGDVPHTLENFGYKDGGIYQPYYTSDVVSELQKKYPVLVAGHDRKIEVRDASMGLKLVSTRYTGHTWLLHGLLKQERVRKIVDKDGRIKSMGTDVRWYVLCNFGFDGSGDGYYLSNSFDMMRGPVFSEKTRAANDNLVTTVTGTSWNFQYEIHTVTGIRK